MRSPPPLINPASVEESELPTPSPLKGEGRGGGEASAKRIRLARTRLTPLAKDLRNNMTDAERRLWQSLRGQALDGHKFRRQQVLGSYIVDFICLPARLIVEVDGGQHLESATDAKRDAWLVEQGFRVMRFWNNDVLLNTEAVLESILAALAAPYIANGETGGLSTPSPLKGVGRGGSAASVQVPASHPLPNPSPVKGEGLEEPGKSQSS